MRLLLVIALLGIFDACSIPELPEHSSPQLLRIYPNPARDNVSISVINTGSPTGTIRVISPEGDIFFEEELTPGGNNEFNVNLSDRPDGYYFVVFDTGNKQYSQKIVKR